MDVSQAFLVFVFFGTILAIIREPALRIGKRVLRVDYGTAPLLALVVLALSGYINFGIMYDAMIGGANIIPWQIILIFFSAAYITISIDSTGFFEYISFKIVNLVKGRGRTLFLALIAFTAVLTIFTSNDIVILSMTPIICYLGKHTKINPIAYLIAVFFSANTWSMIFYIGNPTDIIIAQAFGLGFLEYTSLTLFPTVVAGVTTTVLVFFLLRKHIPKKVWVSGGIDPKKYLRNRKGAVAGVTLLALFFMSLSASDYIGIEIWKISGFFALTFLAMNAVISLSHMRTGIGFERYHKEKTRVIGHAHSLSIGKSELLVTIRRMPWKILPLIFSFFVIVHVFTLIGITELVAVLLNSFQGVITGTLLTGLFSAMAANFMINQPMTILFASAMQSPAYVIVGTNKLSNGLGLVVGSNLGGNLTLFGALAGLMWAKIMRYHGIEMDYRRFISYSLKIIPIVIVITCLALGLRMAFFY